MEEIPSIMCHLSVALACCVLMLMVSALKKSYDKQLKGLQDRIRKLEKK